MKPLPILLFLALAFPSARAQTTFPEITLADGFEISLFADDSQVGNGVAIAFDTAGVLYAAEVNRRKTGVLGVTWTRWWSMEDYAGISLEDREAMFARWAHLVPPEQLSRNTDLVRRLVDTDGDGRADTSTIYATGFNGPLEGNAAGIATLGNTVYLADIPSLWRLDDTDGDGVSDKREELFRGLGVRVGVHGHDLHGLNWGPDGRLYFSLGDRGFNLVNHEGKTLFGPTMGAAFRCFPDGSRLEVFHFGLRNPQDLAFNQFGDLFTVDNDMGGGDECRVVHLLEGAHSGWDASQQLTRNFREESRRLDHPEPPWFSEKLWQTRHPGQPAWITPPIAHLTNGPAGMEFDPGIGLPAKYHNAFFVCDFVGTAARSRIHSFHLEEEGATWRMTASEDFARGILPADIEFGWDGRLYATDWINGWAGEERRLLAIAPVNPPETDTAAIVKAGFKERATDALASLLAHPDRRVRLLAQYELASRGPSSIDLFIEAALSGAKLPHRLQGIWGLWQMGLGDKLPAKAAAALRSLLDDSEPEVRAQAAKVLGEVGEPGVDSRLIDALADKSPRVRYFAALSLGKHAHAPALPALIEMLRDNDDRDLALRHAGVFALSRIAGDNPAALLAGVENEPAAVRRAIALTLRQLQSPALRSFLSDPDPEIVYTATRAIHDLPVSESLEELAALAEGPLLTEPATPFPVAHRLLNANFRLGKPAHAGRLATLATLPAIPDEVRLEALRSLEKWDDPSPFDRVTWHHHPLSAGRNTSIASVIQSPVMAIFTSGAGNDANLLRAAADLIIKYDLADETVLRSSLARPSLDTDIRLAFFDKLRATGPGDLDALCSGLLEDPAPGIRIEAAAQLNRTGNPEGEPVLEQYWTKGTVPQQQLVAARLSATPTPFGDALLTGALKREMSLEQPGPLSLDLYEAASNATGKNFHTLAEQWRHALEEKDPAAGVYQLASAGGTPATGKRIFETHAAQCIRCHTIKSIGGDAGPDLSKIAATLDRPNLLLALVNPGARVAPGFGMVMIEHRGGAPVAGFLTAETETAVELSTPAGEDVTIDKSDITSRSDPVSTMPPMMGVLTPSEMRDLTAYLATLK